VFPYTEDPTIGARERADRLGRLPFRPLVHVELIGPAGRQRVAALVDSGSEHTLVGPWLARATGAQPAADATELDIGIGGRTRTIRFTDVGLALVPPDPESFHRYEWRAEVGIIVSQWEPPWPILLGQVGFYDTFTVTMNRTARGLAVDAMERWDAMFPAPPAEATEPWTFPY